MPRPKGQPKTGGRQRGTPNKATRAWKEFVTEVVTNAEMQDLLVDAISQRPEILLKLAEHARRQAKAVARAPLWHPLHMDPAGEG
jgi:hypothetical protein